MEMREKIIGNSIGSRASFVIAWMVGWSCYADARRRSLLLRQIINRNWNWKKADRGGE